MAEVNSDAAEEKTPAAKKPAAKKPAAAKPAAEKSAAAKPAAKKPASEKPAAEKAPKAEAAAAASDDTASTPTARSTARKPADSKPAAKREAPASRPGVLKAHHLRPAPGSKKERTRVGRGEGSKGKTAGRGTKGTKARYQVRVGLEGGNLNSVMRAPKLRGFTNPFRVEYQVVNLGRLAELYPQGGDVTVVDLVAKGAVRKNEKVKVLGDGELSVKLNVAVDKVSSSAEQKIVAAGGSVQQ